MEQPMTIPVKSKAVRGSRGFLWVILRVGIWPFFGCVIHADRSYFFHGYGHAGCHVPFGLADPDPRIIQLFVGFVMSRWISNPRLQIVSLFLLKCSQPVPIGPLHIGINIHFDCTIVDGQWNFGIGRPRSSVHDQKDGLVQGRRKESERERGEEGPGKEGHARETRRD
eukprot:scaffold144201_cov55-Attheya_sp.AAC.3